MSTAFLQTGTQEMEQEELYTSGVPELKKALGASQNDLLRLVKNIYGNDFASVEQNSEAFVSDPHRAQGFLGLLVATSS